MMVLRRTGSRIDKRIISYCIRMKLEVAAIDVNKREKGGGLRETFKLANMTNQSTSNWVLNWYNGWSNNMIQIKQNS